MFCISCKGQNAINTFDIYVSADGEDNGVGKIDNPFNSIQQAIVFARSFKDQPVVIWLRGGDYFLKNKIVLDNMDDRTISAPLKITSYKNEIVNLYGGIKLYNWHDVTDSYASLQLKEDKKNYIKVINLKKLGLYNYGSPKGNGTELFYDNTRMPIARYPNNDWLHIKDVVQKDTKVMLGFRGSSIGEFLLEQDLPVSWQKEKEIWLHGYWFWDWADENLKVKQINRTKKVISLSQPYHYYGYRKGQRFYAYNLLTEVDRPNEWYLDRELGNLYFYPPKSFSHKKQAVISAIDDLISLNKVSNITIKDLSLSISKNNGITISYGSNNLIDNVVIKNVGNHGVTITESPNSIISNSEISGIGATAILISGGDRKSLLASNMCALNNNIHNYAVIKKTYNPGISLNGVGNCAKNNEIHDAPHIGVFFSGNNHLIEYNKIHNVVKSTNDAGAIYTGRDWSARGNIIRFNYLHDIVGYKGVEAKGIYLDDEASGTLVFGNIFNNVKNAVFIGGGKDNVIDNNIFKSSVPSIHIDNRGIYWAEFMHDQLLRKLSAVPFKSPKWKAQYPSLKNILEENTRLPERNIIQNNIFLDENWSEINKDVEPYIIFKNNKHLLNINLGSNYQLHKKLEGFSEIPFNEIGIQ